MVLTKCYLGFENEQRMFANQNVQNLLKFCQINCDNFQRLIEIEHLARENQTNSSSHSDRRHDKTSDALKILRPLNIAKFLHRDKMATSSSAHEKEDSIIFLSKNDLDNLEIQQQQKQLRQEEISADGDQQTISDKMKVFQPNTKKKWFKNFKNSSSKINSYSSLDIDEEAKRRSVDRYQDMSKLLQERFGGAVAYDSATTSRPSSDLGISPADVRTNLTQKSMSLQDVVEFKSIKNDPLPEPPRETPDLLKIEQNINQIESQPDNDHNSIIDDFVHHDDDDDEHEIIPSQQSFISEKLKSEFHVKTKQHSKSSSNLHQLLHFAVPQKMAVNETKKTKPTVSFPKLQLAISKDKSLQENHEQSMSSYLNASKYSVEDDLPYSNVRDSLIDDHVEEAPATPCENIYAEICTPPIDSNVNVTNVLSNPDTVVVPTESEATLATVVSTTTTNQIDRRSFGSIRISISNNDHQLHHINHGADNINNFYNSIK